MARTPLMRALRRLAQDHHDAELLRVTPAELREQRAEALYTRREIIERGAFEIQSNGRSQFKKGRFGIPILQSFLSGRKIAGIPPDSFIRRSSWMVRRFFGPAWVDM